MKKLTLLLTLFLCIPLHSQDSPTKDGLYFCFDNTFKSITQSVEKIAQTVQEMANKTSEPTIISGTEARKTIKTAGFMVSGTGMFCMSSWLVFDGIKKYSHQQQSKDQAKSPDNNKTQWHPAGKQIVAGIIGIVASVCLIGYSETLTEFFSKKISQEAL